MKKFIVRTILFTLLILLTLVAGEILVRTLPNPYSTKRQLIAEKGSEIKTVFLGNSHTFYGLRTDYWPERAANLSNVSQPLAYDYYILKEYIDSMPNLKRVVMQISFTSLFDDDLANTGEWWREISYNLYLGINKQPLHSITSYEISYFPVYANKFTSLLHLSEPKLISDSDGNGLGYDRPLSDAELEFTGSKISSGHKESSDMRRINKNLNYLLKISEICKERGINLYFFTQPEYDSYRNHADTAYINRMKMEIERFSNIHNARYFDLYSDARFTKEDFFDADHLNHDNGAPKLTKILADSVFNN